MADKKYYIMLTGKNNVLIDVFFTHMQDNFECISCSSRMDDLLNHLKVFKPDMLIYCLNKENSENHAQIVACRDRLEKLGIPLIVAGADSECEEFNKYSNSMAETILPRPFTASLLTEKILKFMQEREEAAAQDGEETAEQERLQREQANRKHVLVIDDDPLILKLIKEHLHEKYEVGTAVSGKVAMKFLEKKTVDLILLDFEMPEENGAAVLKRLHENPGTKDIPVVFLTGITEKGKVREALAQNPQDYLLKPIDKDKLLATISRFIQ